MGEPTEHSTLFAKSVPPGLSGDLSQSAYPADELASPIRAKTGWSLYLILAGVATTLGSSVPVGYNIGVINTSAEVIQSFCNESVISHFNVTLNEASMNILWSSIVSIFIVGGCTGSVLGAYCANSLGRKKAIIVTSFISLFGASMFLLCRAANSVEMLVLGRLLVGLASGLTTSIVPMYLTELSPLALTGAVGVLCPMGVNVGVFVGQFMGLNFLLGGVDDWPYLLSVYAVMVMLCLPLLIILPESPKYLFLVKGNEEKSFKELRRLRGPSAASLAEDIDILRDEARANQIAALSGDTAWSMSRVLSEQKLRLPLLLTCAMQAGQQTSGINAVFYYSQSIFIQGGLSIQHSQYATIGCGFINVCTAVLVLYLLPRVGRRPLLLSSILSASIILTCLAAALKFMRLLTWMPYVCMVLVFLYVLVYGLGLGPIPYFIASEMFEVAPRPAGMAWGSLANWSGNFLVGMCFPTMREFIGPYSFIIFALITAALYVLQKMYFPETQGRTPTQVFQLCSRGFRSRPLLDSTDSSP